MGNEKVAIVTAAGSGMGAAIARELAARNYHVAVFSSSGRGEALGLELGGLGFTGSVTDSAAVGGMVNAVVGKWGRIDAVVNSAPHPPKGDLLQISDEDWHKGLDLVLLNVIGIARLVTPVMEKQGGRSDPQHLDFRDLRTRSAVSGLRKLARRTRELHQAVRGSVCIIEHPNE
jgi:NAD(P)-dependent dehydrogenase (short-subunit alcohol dehydrogenase family)